MWRTAVALVGACGFSSSSNHVDGAGVATANDAAVIDSIDAGPIGGDRPVVVHVPPTYSPGTPMPLVIMLHGYTASGALEEAYLQLTPLSDSRGFLYAYPDGTVDSLGLHFWNATNACCDLDNTMVDDSTYLSQLIVQIAGHYTVDPKRVFFVGHSNGGFMSYRMACDHGDQIAAIASLAGAMWQDLSRCPAADPVSVLEIHGTLDLVIPYNGGTIVTNAFPGAVTTVNDWVTYDGCDAHGDTSSPSLDLDGLLIGNETTVTKFATNCKPGGHAELWTTQGGSHLPALTSSFSPDVIDFLFAHPKP